MTEIIYPQESGEPVVVNLRDPYWAAFLAWLWPGAGHFYQRRYAKGFLFMICILSIFFFGLALGNARVVYASFESGDFRWQYICQLGIGTPALPAIVQKIVTSDGSSPFFVLCERYPEGTMLRNEDGLQTNMSFAQVKDKSTVPPGVDTFKDGFMAPPAGPIYQDRNDVLGQWHSELKHRFEIGTLYTVIAGLLNILVIYDAFAGPAILTPQQKEQMESRRQKKSKE
jgi:hypothetical protein